MSAEWPTRTVQQLQDDGVLLVEDGNHGEYRPRPDEFGPTGTSFIRAADMDGGQILFATASRINDVALQRIRKGIGKPGDILLSHKGTVGKLATAPLDCEPFVCSPQTTFWRVLDETRLDRRFLFSFMNSRAFREQLAAIKGETDMADYASLTAQRRFKVPLIDLALQRWIGRTLGAFDDKIELNRRMNETLEAMAQAIFRNWFVDFGPTRRKLAGITDPVEIMGGVTTDYTGATKLAALFPAILGENGLPQGWEMGRLKDIADVIMGNSPAGDTYNDQGVGTPLVNGPVEYGDFFLKKIKWTTAPNKMAAAGDLIVCVRGSTTGRHAFADGTYCLVRGVAAIRGRSDQQEFADAVVLQQMDRLLERTTGSVFPSLATDDLRNFSTVKPNNAVRLAYCGYCRPMRQRVWANVHENATLAATRDLLLPKLMSGEIRLRDAEAMAEASP